MKILVLDERVGNAMTDEIEEKIDDAEIHLTIHPDGHVNVHVAEGVVLCSPSDIDKTFYEKVEIESEFVVMPHRDEISGKESADVYDRMSDRRDKIVAEAESPLVKHDRVYEGESNSGTETLRGI